MTIRLLLLSSALFVSCAMPRQGYVYSPTQAGRGTLSFPDVQADSGKLDAALANGERCQGNYSTVPGAKVTYDEERVGVIDEEDSQDGMAILECSPGHLLRCSFSRERAGAGMGTCIDNHGEKLTFYF